MAADRRPREVVLKLLKLIKALFPDHPRVSTWERETKWREIVDVVFCKYDGSGLEQGMSVVFPFINKSSSFPSPFVGPRNELSVNVISTPGVRAVSVEVFGFAMMADASESDLYLSWGKTGDCAKHTRFAFTTYPLDTWMGPRVEYRFGVLQITRCALREPARFWTPPKKKPAPVVDSSQAA